MNQQEAIASIQRAYAQGRLFVHMFEDVISIILRQSPSDHGDLHSLCKVLHGDPGAIYRNVWQDVSSIPQGFMGLPGTAIKKGMNIPLFTEMDNAGLLFDGNSEHARPIHVCCTDSYSRISGGVLRFELLKWADAQQWRNGPDLFRELETIQGNPETLTITLSDLEAIRQHSSNAVQALDKLWQLTESGIMEGKLDKDKLFMNEINIAAHLRGLRGIVIYGAARHPNIRLYLDNTRIIADDLHRTYPNIFSEPPPVFIYVPSLKEELTLVSSATRQEIEAMHDELHAKYEASLRESRNEMTQIVQASEKSNISR